VIQTTSEVASAGETTVAASRRPTTISRRKPNFGPGSVDESSRRRDFCDDELEGWGDQTEVN
jgi:hypothetical protein